jgi:hypothetical protein
VRPSFTPVGLEVNREKIKIMYMYMSYHQNAEQNHNMKIPNKSFDNVARLLKIKVTVILPIVLYGHETCFLTLMDKHR